MITTLNKGVFFRPFIGLMFLFSQPVLAEFDHYSIEPISGLDGQGFQIKVSNNVRGYALSFMSYEASDFSLFNRYYDRETGDQLDGRFSTLGLMRIFSARAKYAVADVGIGLGVGSGDWYTNCRESPSDVDQTSLSLGRDHECDAHSGTQIGIPFQATAIVGRYLGVGVALQGFFSDKNNQFSVGFTLPLGTFGR